MGLGIRTDLDLGLEYALIMLNIFKYCPHVHSNKTRRQRCGTWGFVHCEKNYVSY